MINFYRLVLNFHEALQAFVEYSMVWTSGNIILGTVDCSFIEITTTGNNSKALFDKIENLTDSIRSLEIRSKTISNPLFFFFFF